MKRHGNLFDKIIDRDNLYAAYRKARVAKGWMRAVKRFEKDIEGNIEKIREMLVDKTFTTSPYRVKYVYYPKFREIFIVPFMPDRIVQHALMAVVEPIWDAMLVDNTVSCRKGRGTEMAFKLAAKYSSTNKYCLKCDISKFYPSINHDILYNVITRKIKCKDTLWLLKDIVYAFGRQFGTKTNSPIGNYTSQWFGNLYLDILDRKAVNEFKVDYIRYCDDFLFFSNDKEKLREIQKILPEFLMEHRKLRLSKCEVFPTSQGLDFVGYRFFPKGYILLRKRVAKVLKRRFKKLHLAYENGKSIETPRARGQIASSMGILSRCNAYNLKKSTRFYELVYRARIRPRKRKGNYYHYLNSIHNKL